MGKIIATGDFKSTLLSVNIFNPSGAPHGRYHATLDDERRRA